MWKTGLDYGQKTCILIFFTKFNIIAVELVVDVAMIGSITQIW